MIYVPRREFVELARHVAVTGAPRTREPRARDCWSPEWTALLADWERLLCFWGTPGSTCNLFVHGLLAACGCDEPWVCPPIEWPPEVNAIRLWSRKREIRRPCVPQLLPGDLLVWRLTAGAHIGVFISFDPASCQVTTAEGGQPGGRVRTRHVIEWPRPDVAVPLHRLLWRDGTAPTVGAWRESVGLQPAEYQIADDFVAPHLIEAIDGGLQ